MCGVRRHDGGQFDRADPVKKAGIRGAAPARIRYFSRRLKPHDLHHGVAMEILEVHHDLEAVRARLGHTRIVI